MPKTKAKKQKKEKIQGSRVGGSTNHPVGDFLVRIKNAVLTRNKEVSVKSSKVIKSIAFTLKKDGYLDEIEEKSGVLRVRLSYRHKIPVLLNIKLVSKPGLRVYMGVDELEGLKGPSSLIISTPLGVMSSKDAIKKRVGGKVIAEVL